MADWSEVYTVRTQPVFHRTGPPPPTARSNLHRSGVRRVGDSTSRKVQNLVKFVFSISQILKFSNKFSAPGLSLQVAKIRRLDAKCRRTKSKALPLFPRDIRDRNTGGQRRHHRSLIGHLHTPTYILICINSYDEHYIPVFALVKGANQ